MPRYHFVVCAPDDTIDGSDGIDFLTDDAAKDHGDRVVRELKDGGYNPPGAVLHVQDEAKHTIHSIAF
jgi:hypothetical protein